MYSTIAGCPYEEEYDYNWHYDHVYTPVKDMRVNVKKDICATLEQDNQAFLDEHPEIAEKLAWIIY